ncbi:MAG: bifunctional 4-hydroxy-2-oxoglutarate aldolase/2-dehydro-3-deoxy-phosphogluconate aldolase [Sneathiella sp.]|nr:bifunctional 4-hydroxy-2-oxoglutarate aldolase/2-dehydro-3-deoxy-phosphogluconate aldolase [Sneathiella sp.]
MTTIEKILSNNLLIPVVAIDRTEDISPLCEALLEGGISTIEITLRTDAALDCIRKAVREYPEMSIGAGTVLTADHVNSVRDAGAAYGVSPGLTDKLQKAIEASGLAFLPGASTASEVMQNLEYGYQIQKFFPAEAAGGVDFLKSLSAPFSSVQFCPTGGINEQNIKSYLETPNVICVGGSWFIQGRNIDKGNWKHISAEVSRILDNISD